MSVQILQLSSLSRSTRVLGAEVAGVWLVVVIVVMWYRYGDG